MNPPETSIVVLRIALIAGLYLFLLAGLIVAWRDLRAVARSNRQPRPHPDRVAAGHLVVVEAGGTPLVPGDSFPLRPVTSLGRDLSNTIVLPDPATSGEHALLSLRDGHWWLEDLGSRNGTFLNDVPVQGATIVAPGDIIRIGHTRLRLTA